MKVRSLLASGVTVERRPPDIPAELMAEVDRQVAEMRRSLLAKLTEKRESGVTLAQVTAKVDAEVAAAKAEIVADLARKMEGVEARVAELRDDMTESLKDMAVQFATPDEPGLVPVRWAFRFDKSLADGEIRNITGTPEYERRDSEPKRWEFHVQRSITGGLDGMTATAIY